MKALPYIIAFIILDVAYPGPIPRSCSRSSRYEREYNRAIKWQTNQSGQTSDSTSINLNQITDSVK